MGIPNLITHLRPYAELDNLRGDVVIDGPALAYHVYFLCLTLRSGAKNPFEASPTYQELGEAVILWLTCLESQDITVKKIFFDGFLPVSKKDIRISRLQAYTKQLNTYKTAYPGVIPSNKKLTAQVLTEESLFSGTRVPPALTTLPAATFQVPAIIEALCTSEKYGGITQVVPNEADAFCASYVRANGGTILTGDSDLLIHDLGRSGSVVFLKDLDLAPRESNGSQQELKCLQYLPSAIASRLELPVSDGLRNLAFAITMDSHVPFRQLLQNSKDAAYLTQNKKLHKSFSIDYEPLLVEEKTKSIGENQDSAETSQLLQSLHPRLSEFVLQFPLFSGLSWSSFGLSPPDLSISTSDAGLPSKEMSLPFILDYPSRTSAWDISTSIRLTAYSLINLIVPKNQQIQIVIERRRQENGSHGRHWMLPNSEQTQETMKSLLDVLRNLRTKVSGINPYDIWRGYAVYIDLENAKEKAKMEFCLSKYKPQMPSEEMDLRWETIHHIAQFQATYYSLAILKQILSLILSLSTEDTKVPSAVEIEIFRELFLELADLPPLAGLPGFNEEKKRLAGPEMLEVLKVVQTILGIKVAEKGVKAESKKSKKKRNRKDGDSGAGGGKKSNNPFDLLGMD